MKITVYGLERAEGVSHKSGKPKPYAIGQVHAIVALEERAGEGVLTKGGMGTSYEVHPDVIKRVEHLPLPFQADLVIEDVMRFGKRESKVMDIKPLGIVQSAPAEPVRKVA